HDLTTARNGVDAQQASPRKPPPPLNVEDVQRVAGGVDHGGEHSAGRLNSAADQAVPTIALGVVSPDTAHVVRPAHPVDHPLFRGIANLIIPSHEGAVHHGKPCRRSDTAFLSCSHV